jgi:hypothetical protein
VQSRFFKPASFLQSKANNIDSSNEEIEKKILSIRGGSEDKIKGVCIGIDLGTTYR